MTNETSTASEHLQMIEDCETRESRLTEWDAQFLDSIKNQLGKGLFPSLTSKQADKLDEIWERATAQG
jgi:nitrate/nitrite-specific signal transduction histidine kinase